MNPNQICLAAFSMHPYTKFHLNLSARTNNITGIGYCARKIPGTRCELLCDDWSYSTQLTEMAQTSQRMMHFMFLLCTTQKTRQKIFHSHTVTNLSLYCV